MSDNPYMIIPEHYENECSTYTIKVVNNTPYWVVKDKVITFFDIIKAIIGSYYTDHDSCFKALNSLRQELDIFNNLECYHTWAILIQIVTQYVKDLSNNYTKDTDYEENIFDIISNNLNKVTGQSFQEVQVFIDDDLNQNYTVLFFRLYSSIYPVFIVLDKLLKDDIIDLFNRYLKRNGFDKSIIISEKNKKTVVPNNYLYYPLSEFVDIKKETVVKIKEKI